MSMTLLLCGFLFLLPGLPGGKDKRDTVVLKSGKTLEGRVLVEGVKHLVLQQGTRKKEIDPKRIESVKSLARTMKEVLLEYKKLESGDVDGLVKLAKKCQEGGLFHESKLFWWKVLFSNPEHEDANLALGNRKGKGKGKGKSKSKGQWSTRGPKGKIQVVRVRDASAAKGRPWELRSEHAEIVCHGSLQQAVDILLEVEYQYLYFFMLFQPDLEFYEILEPFKLAVFKDRSSYPSLAGSVGAYFSPSDRTVYTFFVQGRPNALHHETTHAIMYMVTEGSAGSRGRLPPWLDEALAEYMTSILDSSKGGRLEVNPGRLDKRHLRVITATRKDKLNSVHRVLNFKSSDFSATSGQALKYAQSYQLLHYLLNGAKEKTRSKFMAYMLAAMRGKGQASTFRKLLRSEYKKIETDYLRWGR